MVALVKGFRRRPVRDRRCGPGGRRWKASQGGNRGEEGGWLGGRELWGFEDRGRLASETPAAGAAQCFQRERRRRLFSTAMMGSGEAFVSVGGGLAISCGHRGRVAARGRRRRRSTVRGGMCGAGHEESILIRRGGAGRAARGPSNVSTMTIRPPQQGQRDAGEAFSP